MKTWQTEENILQKKKLNLKKYLLLPIVGKNVLKKNEAIYKKKQNNIYWPEKLIIEGKINITA